MNNLRLSLISQWTRGKRRKKKKMFVKGMLCSRCLVRSVSPVERGGLFKENGATANARLSHTSETTWWDGVSFPMGRGRVQKSEKRAFGEVHTVILRATSTSSLTK